LHDIQEAKNEIINFLNINYGYSLKRFEDIAEVDTKHIRDLLMKTNGKTISYGLSTASEVVQNKFFKYLSTRAVEMLEEDIEDVKGKITIQ